MFSRISNSGSGFEKKGGGVGKDIKHVKKTPLYMVPWDLENYSFTNLLISVTDPAIKI